METDKCWIQTYSGRAFSPFKPTRDKIHITDIAHALSNQCRFSGHCKSFYSVAEHCVNTSIIASAPDALQALMHDSAEAYLVDLPRPIKHHPKFSFFRSLEDSVLKAIFARYSIPFPISKAVRTIDDILLATERASLMKSSEIPWSLDEPPLAGFAFNYFSPHQAEELFLHRFHSLTTQQQRL